MAISGSLSLYAGEDATITDVIYQADGVTAQNITGWTIQLVISDSYGTALITKTGTPTSPTTGTVSFALANADTLSMSGLYNFKVVRTDTGADTVLTVGSIRIQI